MLLRAGRCRLPLCGGDGGGGPKRRLIQAGPSRLFSITGEGGTLSLAPTCTSQSSACRTTPLSFPKLSNPCSTLSLGPRDDWILLPAKGATLVRGNSFDFHYDPGFSIPEVQSQSIEVRIVAKPKTGLRLGFKLDSAVFDKASLVATIQAQNGAYPSQNLVLPSNLAIETSKGYLLAVGEKRKDMNSQETTNVYRFVPIHLSTQ